MQLLLAKLSAGTISSLVFTCLIIAILLIFFIIWIMWKKNKITGKLDLFMYKTTNFFGGMRRQVNYKLITNASKGEKALYWTVLSSGLVSAVLLLSVEISSGFYTMTFVRSIFFLCMLVLMITFNAKYAPVSPYYYDYNPMLFFYSAISLFFAILDFFMGFGSVNAIAIGVPMIIGEILFFGTIFFTRFSKTNFPPRDILVYIGGIIMFITQVASFAISSFVYPLHIITNIFGLIYNAGMIILLIFFYDGFISVKKLFKK